jgi:hypothetical protein
VLSMFEVAVLAVRIAHFTNRDGSFIIAPFSSTYGYCSPSERQHILACLAACIGAQRRGRLKGTILIAHLHDRRVQYTIPPGFCGTLPKFDWAQLMSALNKYIHTDDPIIIEQLESSYDYQLYVCQNRGLDGR